MIAQGASSPNVYAVEVHKLCSLADSQLRALPGSVHVLKSKFAVASTWQQRHQAVLEEVDSRITDADNLLTDVESLQPPTVTGASSRQHAANAIKTTLAALNTYQLSLQNVQSERQLADRVAAFDHHREHFSGNVVTTRVGLAQIGGPNCLTPDPALPVVGIPTPTRGRGAASPQRRHRAHPDAAIPKSTTTSISDGPRPDATTPPSRTSPTARRGGAASPRRPHGAHPDATPEGTATPTTTRQGSISPALPSEAPPMGSATGSGTGSATGTGTGSATGPDAAGGSPNLYPPTSDTTTTPTNS